MNSVRLLLLGILWSPQLVDAGEGVEMYHWQLGNTTQEMPAPIIPVDVQGFQQPLMRSKVTSTSTITHTITVTPIRYITATSPDAQCYD